MKDHTKKHNTDITKVDLEALSDKPGNLKNDNVDDELLKIKLPLISPEKI